MHLGNIGERNLSAIISLHRYTIHHPYDNVLPARLAPSLISVRQCISHVSSPVLWHCQRIDNSSFMVQFFVLTYVSNRPCIYCSALLLILFVSSCYWSDRCLFDTHGSWFAPPNLRASECSASISWSEGGSFILHAANETSSALVGLAMEELKRRTSMQPTEWTGAGIGWMRSWLGARQWRLPCVDVAVRL